MKPAYQSYQNIGGQKFGNCMQGAIASLFDLPLNKVPHFTSFGNEWFTVFCKFLKDNGYEYSNVFYNKNYKRICDPLNGCFIKEKWNRLEILSLKNLKKYNGINGYYFATVLSPRYFNFNEGFKKTHAVIIDKNCNIVHDSNLDYKNIIKYPLSDLLKYNGVIYVYNINKI